MQKYSAERDKLRDLLAESIRLGVSLDAKFNEGNTLLHFSVALDMYDEVVYLLEAGVNYLITNKEGLSPRDIALEAGNQNLLYLFRRESWYRSYTYANDPKFNPDLDSREQNAKVLSLIARPAVGYADISYTFWFNSGSIGVCENYLDWTDTQICAHLQEMIDLFRVQEQKFLTNLESLKQQRQASMHALSSMHQPLRNHEHKICRKLFTIQELVRQYRDKVNSYAEEKMTYKQDIQTIRKKNYFKGVCQQRVHNGYLVKLWKFCNVTLTGEYLTISDNQTSAGSIEIQPADELDLMNSEDCCRQGFHRVPVKDIYHVETLRSGFHSGSPCVSFGITVKQQGVKDCRHLQTVNTVPSSKVGEKIKLRKLTISIPAIPLDKAQRPSKKPQAPTSSDIPAGNSTEADPADAFPVMLSDITPSYFDDCIKEKSYYAHVFLLALRATSNKIRYGGNYLPPGWQAIKRKSSAPREITPIVTDLGKTPTSTSTTNSETPKSVKKGKVESFFDRIFSSDSATRKDSPQVPQAPSFTTNSPVISPAINYQSDQLSASENDDESGTARRGTATSRESASTQQSVSYSSSLSSSSLPRMSTLLHKSGSNSNSSHDATSRGSGFTTDSSRDSSCTGRPSSSLGEGIAAGYAPTYLETVAEREERQFSSDSEGQFSCKLAAHLAGIVSESVAEPAATNSGLRRKRFATSVAPNADSLWVGSSPTDSSRNITIFAENRDILRSKKSVHYEDIRESRVDSQSTCNLMQPLPSATVALYDVEALSGPSIARSKSLPFKLPSTDSLTIDASVTEEATGSTRNLADIDAAELLRVTTSGFVVDVLHNEVEAFADWRSVDSAEQIKDVTDSMHVDVDIMDAWGSENTAKCKYLTPEKSTHLGFVHPLSTPCTQGGIAVRTTDTGMVKPKSESGRWTPPSHHSLGELFDMSVTGDALDEFVDGSELVEAFTDEDILNFSESTNMLDCPSTEATVLSRIKSDVTGSPSSLLVRATPASPVLSPNFHPNLTSMNQEQSPLMRGQRKHCGTNLLNDYDHHQSGLDDDQTVVIDMDHQAETRETRLSLPGYDRGSAASNVTDPPDDYGSFPDPSFSHNSVYEPDRLSMMFSPRYSTLSSVGGFRGSIESSEDEANLGLIYDPSETLPTSRKTFSVSNASPRLAFIPDVPLPRRMSGLVMLPSGGIDSPSVLRCDLVTSSTATLSTPQTRAERASFCCGSAQSTVASRKDVIEVLKKDSTTSSGRRNSQKNKMIKFRTLDDVRKSLEKIREVSAVGEERLTIALNDREVEHQKFTYLLALRGIVDHLPRVEDRVQFLSGVSYNGEDRILDGVSMAFGYEKEVPSYSDSPGLTGYSNINSSHSATAILAAATASFAAAANTTCINASIGEDDAIRNSLNSRHSNCSVDFAIEAHISDGVIEEYEAECRVISRDFVDYKIDQGIKKMDLSIPPSPLWLSSSRMVSLSGGADEINRIDSTSTSRLSSIDTISSSNMRRSASRSTAVAMTPTASIRNSLGPGDQPILSGSPSIGMSFLRQFSEESTSPSRSHSSSSKALMASKEFLTERFGPEIGHASEVHSLPPVTALLCVPMGQPPAELLDKYNSVFGHLKTIYSLDKAIFDNIQRLAEINHLRDDIRNRYWILQHQANKVTAPRAGDLYDVDL